MNTIDMNTISAKFAAIQSAVVRRHAQFNLTLKFLPSLTVLLASAAVFLTGCGSESGPERVVVSGTVSFNGQPIQSGLIRFRPMRGTNAPVSGAEILNGVYSVTAWGGVPVGKHKIEVFAHRTGSQEENTTPNSPFLDMNTSVRGGQYIPEKYNTKTVLEISIPSGSDEIKKNLDLSA